MGVTIFVLTVSLACMAWCAKSAHDKNLSVLGYGALGFLLGMIGVLVVAVEPPRAMRRCTACGTRIRCRS